MIHHHAKTFLPSALFAGITMAVVYAITQAWMYVAFFFVQLLLDQGIISAEQYDPNAFLGAPFDLLGLLLTVLATIAGVMVAVKLLSRMLLRTPLTKDIAHSATVIFLVIVFILLYQTYFATTYTDLLYGAFGWVMSLVWVAAPTLAFFLTAKKRLP